MMLFATKKYPRKEYILFTYNSDACINWMNNFGYPGHIQQIVELLVFRIITKIQFVFIILIYHFNSLGLDIWALSESVTWHYANWAKWRGHDRRFFYKRLHSSITRMCMKMFEASLSINMISGWIHSCK